MKKHSIYYKCILGLIFVFTISFIFRFLLSTNINKKDFEANKSLFIGETKNCNLYLFLGDVALPNDVDGTLKKISLDITRTRYDAFIISSVLTFQGEEWTWLPKSVGEVISLIDPLLYNSYKSEILNGMSWRNNPNISIKEFYIPEDYKYRKLTHINRIYAISLFNAINKTKNIQDKKERLKKGIEFSIKDIFEKYVSGQKDVSRVCIPAISGIWGTQDFKYFLTYYESWKSVFSGIKRANLKGVNEIYFVIWEDLRTQPPHLKIALKGFLKAYNEYSNKLTFPFFLVCFLSYLFGFAIFNEDKLKVGKPINLLSIPILLFPLLITIFGLLKSDLLSYNLINFMNCNYTIISITVGLICFFCGTYDIRKN